MDLSRVAFIEVRGARCVAALASDFPCRLVVVPGPPAVERVFKLTGLASSIAFGHRPRSHLSARDLHPLVLKELRARRS